MFFRKPRNRKSLKSRCRRQLGEAFATLLIAFLLLLFILSVAVIWNVRIKDQTTDVDWRADLINTRAAAKATLPFWQAESQARIRAKMLAVQQAVNESSSPSSTPGLNKFQERQVNNRPEFTMDEAKVIFAEDTALSRIGFDLPPNPWPPNTEEWKAAQALRTKMSQTSSSAHLSTALMWIKPISDLGLPHEDTKSDFVYGVVVKVQHAAETRMYGDPVERRETPTLQWQQQYGDVARDTPTLWEPPIIPVADDPRCLGEGSPYRRNQCGTGQHLVFQEFLVGDAGELNPRCTCESDTPSAPTNPIPRQGGLSFSRKTDLMEGPNQFKFALGLKSSNLEIPKSPGLRSPVHYYNDGYWKQRGRWSAQFTYFTWVRFSKPFTSPGGGGGGTPDPERLDLDVCTDSLCLPPPGGCVSGSESHWETSDGQIATNPADGVNLVTTVTTVCGDLPPEVAKDDGSRTYDQIIRDQTAYLNALWPIYHGDWGNFGIFRRPAGNNGSGQPMGTIQSDVAQPGPADRPLWLPIFTPAPQSQTGVDPARLRTFAEVQVHFSEIHEESPRYLRVGR